MRLSPKRIRPLSNLDAKLRVEMRAEIRQLQQQLGITAIYVTHDQEEALAISDRIAVMQAGRIEQIGTPDAVYRAPATAFVAEFMGTTNLFSGTVVGHDGDLIRVRTGSEVFFVRAADAPSGGTITFSLRPETLRLLVHGTPPPGWAALTATLVRVEFLGILTRLELRLSDGATLRAASLDLLPDGLVVERPVTVAYDPARVTLFRTP
jgi:ABC-type Fe3+/spermidine/putrescine transport system ATPase subunit